MMNLDEKIRLAKEAGTELDKIKLMVSVYNNLYTKWVNGGRCDEFIRSKLTTIELIADVFCWPIVFNTVGYMAIEGN